MKFWQKYFNNKVNRQNTEDMYSELQSSRKVCDKLFEITGVTIAAPSLMVHLKRWKVPIRSRGGANTRSFWGDLMRANKGYLLKMHMDGQDRETIYREVLRIGEELDPQRKHLSRECFRKNWRLLRNE